MPKKKIKTTLVRRNNSADITYQLIIYNDNSYKLTTLVLNSGCYVVAGIQRGVCNK